MSEARAGVLQGRRILLGVSGGVAAYKAVTLARRLRQAGAELRVVLTRAAGEFVRPLSFQAVTGRPVYQDEWRPQADDGMDHIALARWAETILIAPASADRLARLALGLADDLLGSLCLAAEGRELVLAPAMNAAMWTHPAVQAHVATLVARGARLLGPDSGGQACGEVGPGRLLEPEALIAALVSGAPAGRLAGRRLLITAGPTREPIDAVRFLSNRSSGRMGYALAAAARAAGAGVVLISGPVALDAPAGVRRRWVETAAEMQAAVQAEVADCDIFIGCAAVADYRPAEVAARKIKRDDRPLQLALLPNPDILAGVAARPRPPFTLGFAAETGDLQTHARDKLRRKGLDMIAANRVGIPGEGFDADTNRLEVYWADGAQVLGPGSKMAVAHALIGLLATRYDAEGAGGA